MLRRCNGSRQRQFLIVIPGGNRLTAGYKKSTSAKGEDLTCLFPCNLSCFQDVLNFTSIVLAGKAKIRCESFDRAPNHRESYSPERPVTKMFLVYMLSSVTTLRTLHFASRFFRFILFGNVQNSHCLDSHKHKPSSF